MIFTRRGGPQITVAGPHTPFTGGGPGGPGGPGGSDGGMFLNTTLSWSHGNITLLQGLLHIHIVPLNLFPHTP